MYLRLLHSAAPNPPPTCIRKVTGNVTYVAIGWESKLQHVGFLMPMTLLNIASLCIIVVAMVKTVPTSSLYRLMDPMDARRIYEAEGSPRKSDEDEWEHIITFSQRPVSDQSYQHVFITDEWTATQGSGKRLWYSTNLDLTIIHFCTVIVSEPFFLSLSRFMQYLSVGATWGAKPLMP